MKMETFIYTRYHTNHVIAFITRDSDQINQSACLPRVNQLRQGYIKDQDIILLLFNMIQNITVVDGRGANPAKLQTQLEPVKLSKGMTMAITSIAYGEIYNIHDGNNKIYFSMENETEELAVTNEMSTQEIYKVKIPIGTYKNTFVIVQEIVAAINEKLSTLDILKKKTLSIYGNYLAKDFTLKLDNNFIHIEEKSDTPWGLFNISDDIKVSRVSIENIDLLVGVNPTFLYVNIVKNSYINGKKSRNLAILPLSIQRGYSFYEVKNPVYVPIEVHQFSEILLELRDLNGSLVAFSPKWNTAITLHLKSINRTE